MSSGLLTMKMPTLEQFIRASRSVRDDSRVPYAFEKRIMSQVRGRGAPQDIASLWSRMMWKAAVACVAVSLITGAYASFSGETSLTTTDLLASELEKTVLAPIQLEESW